MATVQPSPEKRPSEDRLIVLCDGIFAIAITLLVLDIRIPALPNGVSHEQFLEAFYGLYEKLITYVITFAYLAGSWSWNRTFMRLLTRLDPPFIALMLTYLAFVAFFPVSCAIVGEYGNFVEAAAAYGLTLALTGLMSWVLWVYASWGHRLIDPTMSRGIVHVNSVRSLVPPLYVGLSLFLLFWLPNATYLFYTWIPLIVISPLSISLTMRLNHLTPADLRQAHT